MDAGLNETSLEGRPKPARRDGCRPSFKEPNTDGTEPVPPRRSETAAHLELKRLALLWAQENGYPIAALEVSLPKCRYRADVAAYRPQRNGTLGHTVGFECKQSAPDLGRDDCRSPEKHARLESVCTRHPNRETTLPHP